MCSSVRSEKFSGSHSLYTDGGARGNPGPGAAGFVLKKDGKVISKGRKYLGEVTNNQAEYSALILGLDMAKEEGVDDLECFLDSELIVKQLNGEYRVRDSKLIKLFEKVNERIDKFDSISFLHVVRSKNKEADSLVNQELDRRTK